MNRHGISNLRIGQRFGALQTSRRYSDDCLCLRAEKTAKVAQGIGPKVVDGTFTKSATHGAQLENPPTNDYGRDWILKSEVHERLRASLGQVASSR